MRIDPIQAAMARDPDAIQRILEEARAARARELARLFAHGAHALRGIGARLRTWLLEGRPPGLDGHGRATA